MSLHLMADSIDLSQIPESFRADRTKGVLLYANGRYVATAEQAASWPRRQWISVTGDARAARYARFLDVERFDATAADWPAFRSYRDGLCKDGIVQGWPGVYCSIDPGAPYGVQQVVDACKAAGQELPQHWFIAWYTDSAAPPTADKVAAEIEKITGFQIDPATIWGCQYDNGGHYDLSVVYQPAVWE